MRILGARTMVTTCAAAAEESVVGEILGVFDVEVEQAAQGR